MIKKESDVYSEDETWNIGFFHFVIHLPINNNNRLIPHFSHSNKQCMSLSSNTMVTVNMFPIHIMLAHDIRGRCWLNNNRSWIFLTVTHAFFFFVADSSLAEWYLIWKFAEWMFMECKQWIWTQVIGNVAMCMKKWVAPLVKIFTHAGWMYLLLSKLHSQ